MANPNIVNVSAIYGKIVGQLVTTVATAIITNTAASGKILKINSLRNIYLPYKMIKNIYSKNNLNIMIFLIIRIMHILISNIN